MSDFDDLTFGGASMLGGLRRHRGNGEKALDNSIGWWRICFGEDPSAATLRDMRRDLAAARAAYRKERERMKLSNRMKEALAAVVREPGRSAYPGLSLATLNALEGRRLVKSRQGFGSLFCPRTHIEWRATVAGVEELAWIEGHAADEELVYQARHLAKKVEPHLPEGWAVEGGQVGDSPALGIVATAPDGSSATACLVPDGDGRFCAAIIFGDAPCRPVLWKAVVAAGIPIFPKR